MRRLLRWTERFSKTDIAYLASSGFWLNAQFAISSILALVASIAFANILTKDQFGTYQYILSVASLLGALTLSGYNTAITRSVARGFTGSLRASMRPQLLWDLIPAALAFLIAGWYVLHGADVLAICFVCVGITLPIINAANSYTAYLAGLQDFKRVAVYGIVTSVAYYGLLLIGIWKAPQVLVLILINFGVNALATWFFYARTVRAVPPEAPTDPEAYKHAQQATLLNVLGAVASQIDSVLVFKLLGPVQLARYSLAKVIPERAGGVFKILTFSVVTPRFSKQEYGSIRQTLLFRSVLVLVAVLAAAAAYAALAPLLLHLLYPTYPDIITYSQFYALTFVIYVGGLANSALQAHRRFSGLYSLAVALPAIQICAQVVGVIFMGLWGLIIARVLMAIISAVATLALALRETTS